MGRRNKPPPSAKGRKVSFPAVPPRKHKSFDIYCTASPYCRVKVKQVPGQDMYSTFIDQFRQENSILPAPVTRKVENRDISLLPVLSQWERYSLPGYGRKVTPVECSTDWDHKINVPLNFYNEVWFDQLSLDISLSKALFYSQMGESENYWQKTTYLSLIHI